MIDSEATENFISNIFVIKNCIPYQAKEKPYELTITDESPSNYGDGWVQMETKESTLMIGQHSEQINLDIMWIPRHNIILGIPWLKTHNPHIDWKTEEIRFSETPKSGVRPERQPEGQNQSESIEIQEISGGALKCMWQQGEQVGVLYVRPREVREVRTLTKGQETARPPIQEMENVLKEYWDFQDVFQERGKGQLPEHQSWDHKILLKPGTQPAFKPIYPLSEKEHEALQEYINKNLE